MDDIYVVLVIYNKSCLESITFNELMKHSQCKVIVCDNSERDFNNRKIVEQVGYTYVDMHGNQGLSVAYNKAIKTIKDKNGYVCILDDDTNITDYFEAIKKYLVKGNADIYLPVIVDQQGILSPCKTNWNKFTRFKSIDDLSNHSISAINSGMIIKITVFDKVQYDTNLFLDYIDHQFMKEVQKTRLDIVVMKDIIVKQNFSLLNNTVEQAIKRETIIEKDLRTYYKKQKLSYYYCILKRRIFLVIKYKRVLFLFGK